MTATIHYFPASRVRRRSDRPPALHLTMAAAPARDLPPVTVGDRVLDTYTNTLGTVTELAGSFVAVRLDGGIGVSRCVAELLPLTPPPAA